MTNTDQNVDLRTAYRMGESAYRQDKPRTNPFHWDTPQGGSWEEGWENAKMEDS